MKGIVKFLNEITLKNKIKTLLRRCKRRESFLKMLDRIGIYENNNLLILIWHEAERKALIVKEGKYLVIKNKINKSV